MSERIQGVCPKEYKGVQYKSTLEAETAETLDKLGLPINYEARKIILLEGFRCPYQKNKVIGITYKPDFMVGDIIIECKGFETPEWRNKKKYIFKYLMENEPDTPFYQTHNSKKDVLLALDNHWSMLGFAIKVTSRGSSKKPSVTRLFDSVRQAMIELGLNGKNIGPILRVMMGEKEWAYNYNWSLKKLKL